MPIVRRIFVSLPSDDPHSQPSNDLKWAIVDKIAAEGFTPEIFANPRGGPGLATGRPWSAPDADEIMRKCVGAAILGFPRWNLHSADGLVKLATEFNHYEGALARTLGLPILVLRQDDVSPRVVFDYSFNVIGKFQANSGLRWLKSKAFQVPFDGWVHKLNQRRDVFLGYCGQSKSLAGRLRTHLKKSGVTVLDWQRDFKPANSIFEQIRSAAARTSGGIFLFTKDDRLAKPTGKAHAAPRDNVVFEAGYFAALKGKENVLVVLEKGAKMPADLGGDIYASLPNLRSITPIVPDIQKFLDNL